MRIFSRKHIHSKNVAEQEYPITWYFRCVSTPCPATLKADVTAAEVPFIGHVSQNQAHSCNCQTHNLRYEIEKFARGLVEKGTEGASLAQAYNLQIEETRAENAIALGMIPQRLYFASMFQRKVSKQNPPVG